MSGARDNVFFVGIALLPLCSIQHFIWPLSWCLLADISNHTWIPECGYDELLDSYRLFIDECDMFEYNCDHETDYEAVNYSDCFKQRMCPVANIPCPSRPTCPDHRYHRAGDKYVYLTTARKNARRNMRRDGMRKEYLRESLPPKMLKGRRRYTPKGRKKKSTKNMLTKIIYRKIVIKRRKLARSRKHTRQANKPSPTRTQAVTRTSIRVPTRTTTQATIRSIPVKPSRTATKMPITSIKQKTIREVGSISSAPGPIRITLSVHEPIRTILSTAPPITFQTFILKKYTIMRFGKKMIRVVKGRVS